MNKLHRWLSGLPTTQFRILVSTFGFFTVLIIGVIKERPIQSDVLWFILGWGFNDVLQFGAKRFSEQKVANSKESEDGEV